MESILHLSCFALLMVLACGLELKASIGSQWETFKSVHKKSYRPAEELKRKEIFRSNVEAVLSHNLNADLGFSHHKLGINTFSDLDEKEVKNLFGLNHKIDLSSDTGSAESSKEHIVQLPKAYHVQTPESRDWRSHMAPVKDQGSVCGSCWAFSTTALIEGFYSIKHGIKVTLSEQQLIDCTRTEDYGNEGCSSGRVALALYYVIENRGISSDTCYPYEEKDGECRYNASCNSAQISKQKKAGFLNDNAILEVVGNHGPVSVAIDAPSDLIYYTSGVYSNPNCSKDILNHGVVIVGYGTENNVPYWLIRNSWGSKYGIEGHFKLLRGNNECGVARMADYIVS